MLGTIYTKLGTYLTYDPKTKCGGKTTLTI